MMANGGKIMSEQKQEKVRILRRNSVKYRDINENTPTTRSNTMKMNSDSVPSKSPQQYEGEEFRTPRVSRRKSSTLSTPHKSEKRRSLFKENSTSSCIYEENDLGIKPLSPTTNGRTPKNKKPFQEFNNECGPTFSKKKNSFENTKRKTSEADSQILPKKHIEKKSNEEEINTLMKKVSLKNKKSKRHNDSVEEIYSTDEDEQNLLKKVKRRLSPSNTPKIKTKLVKLENSPILQIPTKSFYSSKIHSDSKSKPVTPLIKISPTVLNMVKKNPVTISESKDKKTKWKSSGSSVSLANKGVGHRIKKNFFKTNNYSKSIEDFLKTIKSNKLKSLPSKRVSMEKVREVHSILKTTLNPIEMARPLIIDCEKDISARFSDSDESENEALVDHDREAENDTNMSPMKTYSKNCSPLKRISNQSVQENISPTKTKKFFKSGHTSAKEVKITDNIKLGVSCGKMSLLSEKKKKQKYQNKSFLNEQAAVNDIIKKLSVSPEKNDNVNSTDLPESLNIRIDSTIENEVNPQIADVINVSNISNILNTVDDVYAEFRARIPYRTIDPNEIERQNLLLDFLITNNICTEKNFEIFIADPDNHKEEADEIINSMVEVVPEEPEKTEGEINLDPYEHFRNQIPYNTNDPEKAKEQRILLDFLIENKICNEETFTIFIKDLENRKNEAEAIIEKLSGSFDEDTSKICGMNATMGNAENQKDMLNQKRSPEKEKLYPIFYSGKKYMPIENKFTRDKKNREKHLWKAAMGSDQYQIDAGQKQFGAKQCPQCGLVYTVHEPEEEIIHKEYHSSIYALKFRGWIDEDIIGNYFEWSNDGRIIRITSSEHIKKKERLLELLKIVDKELGFSSYILPDNYVAFLAVRKNQFVGLCLVQFLSKANRYVKINGVDCCTEQSFDAKIGISRIWVSPFCRRMGIASKLIQAARSHAIAGDVIDVDKIAFSAPTEDGKLFAQKISQRTDFLVYC